MINVFTTKIMTNKCLLLYVDVVRIGGHEKSMINMLKKDLGIRFAMKDLGQEQQRLGMRIIHDRKNKGCHCHKKGILRRC